MIRRLSVAVAAVVLTGTVASGCSTFSNNSNAAEAGGAELSVADFEQILADFTESQEESAPTTTTTTTLPGDTTLPGETTTTVDPTIPGDTGRSFLTRWVRSHLLLAGLAEAGTPVDDAAKAAAETSLSESVGESWAKLSSVTKQFLIDDQAATDALASGNLTTPEEAQDAYERGVAFSNALCLRAIAFIDEAEADDAYAQLESGADFATLANENSTDPATANGGIIITNNTGSECTAADELNEAVVQGVSSVPIGRASQPLPLTGSDGSTQHIIILQRPWSEVTDAALPIVRAALAPATESRLIGDASVHVDSRYGTWDPEQLTVVPAR